LYHINLIKIRTYDLRNFINPIEHYRSAISHLIKKAGSVVEATLGFMLGFGMINKLILSKNEAAKEKAAKLREKLAPKLGKLGIFGLIVGGWMIAASFLFTVG